MTEQGVASGRAGGEGTCGPLRRLGSATRVGADNENRLAEENSDTNVISLKLSDVTAAKQQVLTGAAVMLTVIGLTAVAAANIGSLLPDLAKFAPGARPVPVYLAAVALPLAGLMAFSAARFGSPWKSALLKRLACKEAPVDQISDELHNAFLRELEVDYSLLVRAQSWFLFAAMMLYAHAFAAVAIPWLLTPGGTLARALGMPALSDAGLFYYFGALLMVVFFGWQSYRPVPWGFAKERPPRGGLGQGRKPRR